MTNTFSGKIFSSIPCASTRDVAWIAFRHLFDQKSLLQEFAESQKLQQLKAQNKLSDLFKWTEETAAKSPVGGGPAPKAAVPSRRRHPQSDGLGDLEQIDQGNHLADPRERRHARCASIPIALRLQGFYPIPKPIYAVVTTDTMIPKAFYDLYASLAADLDDTSRRISDLTAKIKVRGGYNAANKDIANLLTADDGKMLPVDGVDLMSGGLQNHIWLVPILEWVNALKELYAQPRSAEERDLRNHRHRRHHQRRYQPVRDRHRAAHEGHHGHRPHAGRQAARRQFRPRSDAAESRHHRQEFRRRNADQDDRRRRHARSDGRAALRLRAASAPSTSRPTAPSRSTRPPRKKATPRPCR